MKDKSIRKLYLQDTRLLEDLMGFAKDTLKEYSGRYVKIIIKSPRKIKGCGRTVYHNG